MALPTIVTRAGKGSALTWTEGDANLTNLRDATISVTDGTNTAVLNLNDTLTLTAGTNVTLSVNASTDTVTINSTASGGATTLDGLTDTVITAAASGDVLRFNGTNWVDYPETSLSVGTLNGTVGATTPNTGVFTGLTAKGTTSTAKLTLDTTAISSTAWTTAGIGLKVQAATFTDTSSTAGTIAASHVHAIAAPTLASTNAITITDAAALYVNAPSAGTNTTITNSYALFANGRIRTTGNLSVDGSISANSGYNGTVGATTANTGAFTTLSASSTVSGQGFTDRFATPGPIGSATASSGAFTSLTVSGTTTLSPANANIAISPTGTGTVTISPAGALTINPTAASTINNTSIGVTTAAAGRFTTLTTTSTITLSPVNASATISPTGTGTVTIAPATAGTINNMSIGATTALTGKFTSLEFKNPLEPIFDLGTTGGTIAPDCGNGSVQKITLNAALTLNAFTNPTAGESLTLIIYGGTAYTSITSTMKFAGGVKTLTATAGCIDILSIYYDGTNYFASLGKGFA